jgi:hypothetical protein
MSVATAFILLDQAAGLVRMGVNFMGLMAQINDARSKGATEADVAKLMDDLIDKSHDEAVAAIAKKREELRAINGGSGDVLTGDTDGRPPTPLGEEGPRATPVHPEEGAGDESI